MQASSSQLVCNPALSVPTTDGLMSAYSGPDTMIGSDVVTLMIRRLPRTYMLSDIRAEIESVVPSYAYNYVYHPWDIQKGSNSNYAFVNFVNPKWAMQAFLLLSGKTCRFAKHPTVCKISEALLQGLGLNLANYVISYGIMTQNANEPVVFTSDHQQVDFRFAVKTFCSPGDFCTASMQLLRKQQGKAAAVRLMEDCEREVLIKEREDQQVAIDGSSNHESSSIGNSKQSHVLQQDPWLGQTLATQDIQKPGCTTSLATEYPPRFTHQATVHKGNTTFSSSDLIDVEHMRKSGGFKTASETALPQGYTSLHSNNVIESVHFQATVYDNSVDRGFSSGTSVRNTKGFIPGTQLGQLSNPALSGHTICQNQSPEKVASTNPAAERLRTRSTALKDLKVAGILSREFVQLSANGIQISSL